MLTNQAKISESEKTVSNYFLWAYVSNPLASIDNKATAAASSSTKATQAKAAEAAGDLEAAEANDETSPNKKSRPAAIAADQGTKEVAKDKVADPPVLEIAEDGNEEENAELISGDDEDKEDGSSSDGGGDTSPQEVPFDDLRF